MPSNISYIPDFQRCHKIRGKRRRLIAILTCVTHIPDSEMLQCLTMANRDCKTLSIKDPNQFQDVNMGVEGERCLLELMKCSINVKLELFFP